MGILRKTFSQGRMNLDIENRLLPDGDYREATNVVVIGNESNNEGSVRKSFSTKKITNLDLGDNPICLGTFAYNARNRVYWLILSDVRACLIEHDFNNNVSSFVLNDSRPIATRVFNLKKDFFCTAINIVAHEDINKELFLMTENNIEPLCINIERAKKYSENGFDKEDIYLIKRPPLSAPLLELTYTGGLENYMEDSFQLFFTRYKFLDGEYSAFSDFTNYQFAPGQFELDYQTLENKGMINQFNAVKIFFNTGDKRVTDVQVLLKKTNSNVPYLIETFNKEKEQWSDNDAKSFIFSNEKIYKSLPEKELFRTSDNVPRKALAQTLIGNKAIFGNYLEGYNLLDNNFQKIKINYLLSIVSKNISGSVIPKIITPTINSGSTTLTLNFTGIALKKDTSIRFSLDMKSSYLNGAIYTDNGDLDRIIDYVLNNDFATVQALATDPSFILFVQDTLSNFLFSTMRFVPPTNGALQGTPKFSFTSSGNNIIITAPTHIYKIDNTPADLNDNNFTNRNYIWLFTNETEVLFRNFTTASTVKSNRSYSVGLLYMDAFKRKTIVLTCSKNTIYIPQLNSVNKNTIKVSLDSPAPHWATSFKFVIKQQPLDYNIIYGIKFYEDGLFRWLKLEGANIDKIKIGDTLIVKSDLGGAVANPIKTLVLEKTTKSKDFIKDNLSLTGALIIEEEGTYIKLKPLGYDMNYNNATAMSFGGNQHEQYPFRCFTAPLLGNTSATNIFTPFSVGSGSQIRIYIQFEARGSIEYKAVYDKRFTVAEPYNSIQEWFVAEVKNLGSFGQEFTWNGITDIGNERRGAGQATIWNEISGWGWTANGDQFYVVPSRKGTASRKITTEVRFEVLFTEGLMIFETEPKQIENENYFECSKSYEIENGLHKGDLNQTALTPAVIELDFFNCYTQGNGAESYQVKDSVLKPYLNVDTKPTTTSIEEYKEIRRSADLTYSESFVESSNVNGLNVFNLSTVNFKDDLDKEYGSIQRIHSRENDIVVLQEDKAGKVLFGKDALYTADGETALTGITKVLGQYIPYQGNRGIGQNPESFSIDDFGRIKYASVKNGSIVRLSTDGIEDITYGLKNFFRNLFLNNFKSKIISGYDSFLNLTYFSIGDEIIQTPTFNCNDQIIKSGQNTPFDYVLLLNNLTGNIIFNYNIILGTATIQVIFNNVVQVVSNVTGVGTITVPRTNLIIDQAFITITPVSPTINYTITNTCPIGTQLEIITVVLNDSNDITKSITNRFKSNTSAFIEADDIFTAGPVTRFESFIGIEGVGSFPDNGSLITIQSLKETTNSGKFEINNCNRLGYLISSTVYTSAQYQTILNNPNTQFLTVSESGESDFASVVSGSFLFNRSSLNQKLYLIWDYVSRNPIALDDNVSTQKGTTKIIDVLANDTNVGGVLLTVTIITQPINGSATVLPNGMISYVHNNTDTLSDSLTYQISNGACSAQAKVFIDIAISCNQSFSFNGAQGTFEFPISYGTALGNCGINYDSFSIPDQFEIIYNGVVVATTGGLVSGSGELLFNKTTAQPTVATIRVTATNSGTAWNITGRCPVLTP